MILKRILGSGLLTETGEIMKLGQKLLIIGISILLLIGLSVHFFSEYQTGRIIKSYRQSDIVSMISRKLVEAHNAINRFQIDDIINEEYYEEGKSENLQEYEAIMDALRNYEYEFFKIYRGEDSEVLQSCFRSIVGNLDESFKTLVNAYNLLGYNDYGLEGKFSEVRHNLTVILEDLDDPVINAELESLKVQEMKLIHRKSEKYCGKITDALGSINEMAQLHTLDIAGETAEYLKYVNNYYEQCILIGLNDNEGLRLDLKNKQFEAEEFFRNIAEKSNDAMYKASRNKTIFGLVFIIAGIIISSVAFFIFSWSLTKPLYSLSVIAKRTADGDLLSKIDNKLLQRKDEIGILADSFSKTVLNLKSAIEQIKESSEKNRQVGEVLRESADMSSRSVEIVSDNMISVTELFRNLDQNISRSNEASKNIISSINGFSERINGQVTAVEQISAIIEELSASLNSIAGITADKKKISDSLVNTTREGDARIRETNAVIKEIADSTGKMKELTELINGIASQTNLLSMNAAIEAAHAGDAGRGFSVVAEEIRKLSEETADGVKGISLYLNSVVEQIDKALVASENSGKAFIKVDENVSGNAEAFNGIAQMVLEASSGSDEMLKAIIEIRQVTHDLKGTANDIKEVLTEMGSEMDEIADLSKTGTHDIENALKAIKEIDINTSNVADLSDSNEKIIEELTGIVENFRISEKAETDTSEGFDNTSKTDENSAASMVTMEY